MAAAGILVLLVLPGLCSGAVLYCDFDTATKDSTVLPCECSGRSCVLDQVTENFQWTAYQGQTPTNSGPTGPDDDHTRTDGAGLYIYTEVTGVHNNSVAEIQTPALSLSVTSCLTFWYHMKGNHIGDLQVLAADTDGTTSVIWERRGQQGDNWLSASATLGQCVTQVSFRSTRRGLFTEPHGDMALDDVRIEETACDTDTISSPDPCPATATQSTTAESKTTTTTSTTPTTRPTTPTTTTTTSTTTTTEYVIATRLTPTTTLTTSNTTGTILGPTKGEQSCSIPWGLFGVTLGTLLASITVNVVSIVRNRRSHTRATRQPNQPHYVNAELHTQSEAVKDKLEASTPTTNSEAQYELVGTESDIGKRSMNAAYINSPGSDKSEYEDIPSDGAGSRTEHPSADYEHIKQVRQVAPNPYDVMA